LVKWSKKTAGIEVPELGGVVKGSAGIETSKTIKWRHGKWEGLLVGGGRLEMQMGEWGKLQKKRRLTVRI
jgi:hypothetical protein